MPSSDFASTSQTVPKCVICDSVSDKKLTKLTEVGLLAEILELQRLTATKQRL